MMEFDEKRLRRWTDPLEGFIDAGPLQDCLAELDRLRQVECAIHTLLPLAERERMADAIEWERLRRIEAAAREVSECEDDGLEPDDSALGRLRAALDGGSS